MSVSLALVVAGLLFGGADPTAQRTARVSNPDVTRLDLEGDEVVGRLRRPEGDAVAAASVLANRR